MMDAQCQKTNQKLHFIQELKNKIFAYSVVYIFCSYYSPIRKTIKSLTNVVSVSEKSEGCNQFTKNGSFQSNTILVKWNSPLPPSKIIKYLSTYTQNYSQQIINRKTTKYLLVDLGRLYHGCRSPKAIVVNSQMMLCLPPEMLSLISLWDTKTERITVCMKGLLEEKVLHYCEGGEF